MNMKRSILFLIAFCLAATTFAGCGTGDGDKDYGYPYVLMPQAQRLEGYYAVPGGVDRTYNFRVEDGKIKVFLGVLRSGKVANEAFSVSVDTNGTFADDFIYDRIVPEAEPMPASIYTLPSSVNVPAGTDQAEFYLDVDADAVLEPEYDGKNLVLCIELKNPTVFKLSRESFYTIVVLDVDAIREFL